MLLQLFFTERYVAALKDVKIISKPSVHTYVDKFKALRSATKYDLAILSTTQGIMSHRKSGPKNGNRWRTISSNKLDKSLS